MVQKDSIFNVIFLTPWIYLFKQLYVGVCLQKSEEHCKCQCKEVSLELRSLCRSQCNGFFFLVFIYLNHSLLSLFQITVQETNTCRLLYTDDSVPRRVLCNTVNHKDRQVGFTNIWNVSSYLFVQHSCISNYMFFRCNILKYNNTNKLTANIHI